MRVLVACEFSGIVRDAFRKRHDAWSCDLLPTEAEDKEHHIIGDVLDILDGHCGHTPNEHEEMIYNGFMDSPCPPCQEKKPWDLMIAHPPCTYLCSSGLHWNGRRSGRDAKTHEAMLFVLNLMGDGFISHGIQRIALENPVGCISTKYRKPDQIIQPWQFGHDASKATCLWLKNLPPLLKTKVIEPSYGCQKCRLQFSYALGKYGCPNACGSTAKQIWANQTLSGQNKLWPSKARAMERSRTYQGIAEAMADQWGSL